jgi:hypothetical protein
MVRRNAADESESPEEQWWFPHNPIWLINWKLSFFSSISLRTPIFRSLDRVFRFLPEPCSTSTRDSRTPVRST